MVSIVYGPQAVGRFTAQGEPWETSKKARAPRCGNDGAEESVENAKDQSAFPPLPCALGNPAKSQNAGFPHYSGLRTIPGEARKKRANGR